VKLFLPKPQQSLHKYVKIRSEGFRKPSKFKKVLFEDVKLEITDLELPVGFLTGLRAFLRLVTRLFFVTRRLRVTLRFRETLRLREVRLLEVLRVVLRVVRRFLETRRRAAMMLLKDVQKERRFSRKIRFLTQK